MMMEENKEKEAKFVSEIQSTVCQIGECESRIDQLKLHRQHVEKVLMEGRLMMEENEDLKRLCITMAVARIHYFFVEFVCCSFYCFELLALLVLNMRHMKTCKL
jgi:hypothetical protein